MQHQTRKLENIQAQQLLPLFKTVWTDKTNHAESIEWAFQTSPLGDGLIFTSWANDNLSLAIGARGSIPWPLKIAGSDDLIIHQFHGTCVHPQYRRQGIFNELNQIFLREFENIQGAAIFNVSVLASRYGYEKLGWSYIEGLRRFLYIANPVKFSLKWLKQRSNIRGELATLRRQNQKAPEWGLLSSLSQVREDSLRNYHHTAYDEKLLNWRYSRKNEGYSFLFRPNHYWCSYKLRQTNLFTEVLLGDVWLSEGSSKIIRMILKELISIEKADIVSIILSQWHPWKTAFRWAGFLPDPKGDLYFGVRIVNEAARELLNPQRWALMTADIDTF